MSAAIGRALVIKREGTKIAAVQEKSIAVNNEPIDVSSDDDEGVRKLLEDSSTRTIDLNVSGLLFDDTLAAKALSGTGLIETYQIVYPSGMVVEGEFRFNSYESSGSFNDAVKFSATFQSTGSWTVTP